MRVAILYPEADPNGTTSQARGDEAQTLEWSMDTWDGFLASLAAEGWEPIEVGISFSTLGRIAELDADVVLNLCDGCTVDGEPGVEVIDALEARGLPYTGARRTAYWLGSDKVRMKLHFLNAGVRTARFQVVDDPDEPLDPNGPSFPLFVKPRDAAGSAGVGLTSRVDDPDALRERLREIIPTYGPALVEEFIDGRELSVGVIGEADGPGEPDLTILPPVEVRFGPAYPESCRVQTFETKFDPSSPLFHGYELICPAPLEADEAKAVVDTARAAYRAIQGTGYGRVDMRLGPDGPYVLEVNPNCSLEWSCDPRGACLFPFAAQAVGWNQGDVYRRLLEGAIARHGRQAGVEAPAARTAPRRRR
jgi:D-alanine-D-alanine ligase